MKSLLNTWIFGLASVFRTELTDKPANIAPYKLNLKEMNDWNENNTNRSPPRWQILSKKYEVERFINKAIANKLIRPSDAAAWSQILLTPKPNGSWRFCIDFRQLNLNCKSAGWPIPNIKHILERISKTRAKYFAVIDLTQGYYQIPIDESSKHLTAFRTALGLFEWNRLPMGLKGAGSYYQSQMTNTVFPDLLYKILEIYLDDILIYAKTKEELSENLKIVLNRLKKFGLTVNPDKVKINMNEVEYVGHLIDDYGVSFTQEKRDKVLDFRLPVKEKELKQFLGLISQFRDHVPNFAELSAPLYDMMPNYKRNSSKLLDWTSELKSVYYKLQDATANCCKLYFIDDNAPVFLHTDASNYGIGGYLYQVIDDIRVPIQFVSRKLNKRELKWNTVEKEAYAIFHCFMKLDHLLRDRYFLLRTDSEVVSRMNVEHKQKVKRWKLAIQHFDFDVEHIKGELNIEADGFSRLVKFPKKEEPNEMLCHMEQTPIVAKTKYLSKQIYEKIRKVHNAFNGHVGVQKTLQRLNDGDQRWAGMRNDVKEFVKTCPCCQKMKMIKPIIHTLPYTLASYCPMQRIFIDAIGPINVDSQVEFKHILVIIDAFSRYVRLFPIKSINSDEVLKAFFNWIADFGCPSEIVSDNASYLVSELIKSFVAFTGIDHKPIHPYSHEENGMVERANYEVIRFLTACVADVDVRANWPTYTPFVQRIMNTMVKTSTGVSPTELLYGNTIDHDSTFMLKPKEELNIQTTYVEHMANLLKIQEKIIKIAQASQESVDIYNITKRVQIHNETTEFPIGSYVLAEYETGKSSKFHTKRHGPYRVVNKLGPIYSLENLVTNKITDFHVLLLSEYHHDDDNSDIYKVAKIDEEFQEISSVLNHRFKSNKKRTRDIQLQMTWDNDPNPKWYDWNSTFGAVEKVQKYLNDNQMRKYIPIKYTWDKTHPNYEPPIKRSKFS